MGSFGRHGNGSGANVLVPTEVPAVSGLFQAGAQFFIGGRFTFAFQPADPALADETPLTKILQKLEGTTIPANTTFTFTIAPRSFNGNIDDLTMMPQVPNRTITFEPGDTGTTANGITTLSRTVDALEGIEFDRAGIYVYIVTESANSQTSPPHTMTYSTAEYDLRITVIFNEPENAHEVAFTEIILREADTQNPDLPPVDEKVDGGMIFTNTLTQTTGDATNAALTLTKTVTGGFGDRAKLFNFTIALVQNPLAPLTLPISFNVRNAAGAIDPTRSGTITALTPPQSIQLRHGERFEIVTLPVGTGYTIIEAAAIDYRASATVITGGGSPVNVTPPEQDANQELSTGVQLVASPSPNRADFTNTFEQIPATGLVIEQAPFVLLALFVLGISMSYLALKQRKKVENLPLVQH
jgi:hypothetical protein